MRNYVAAYAITAIACTCSHCTMYIDTVTGIYLFGGRDTGLL